MSDKFASQKRDAVSPAAEAPPAAGSVAASEPESGSELQETPPLLVRASGTFGSHCVRFFDTDFRQRHGSRPESIRMLAVDSTDQARLHGASQLSAGEFVNVSAIHQPRETLRRAREDRRVHEYLSEPLTRLPAGDGAGGYSAVARFFYEKKERDLEAAMREVLNPFTPSRRAAMANRANRHPALSKWGMKVKPEGPIRSVYAASSTGGTVGMLVLDVMKQNDVMRQMGIESNTSLLLTLPATFPADDVEARRLRANYYGLMQQILDLAEGKVVSWPLAGERTLTMSGCPFDSVLVLAEPAPGRLTEQQRFVGDLLGVLASPVGAELFRRGVDRGDVHTKRGSHGQLLLLDLVGLVFIEATGYQDVAAYARAVLGQKATAPGSFSNAASLASDLLRTHQLTVEAVESVSLTSTAPAIPEDLQGDPGTFLDWAEDQVRKSSRVKAVAAAKDFQGRCHAAAHHAVDLLRRGCRKAGPHAALGLGRELIREARATESTVGAATPRPSRPESAADDVSRRLAARVEAQRAQAAAEFRSQALAGLRQLAATIEDCLGALEPVCSAFDEERLASQRRLEVLDLQPAPAHALLDRPALSKLIGQDASPCANEARELAARVLASPPVSFDAAALLAILDRRAAPFARLADVDEAFRAAGPDGVTVLENAAAAAQPAVRTDPQSDYRRHCVSHAYMNVSSTHPLAAILARQARQVLTVAENDASRIVIVRVDYGVEPAALLATREALEAYVESPTDIPPFPDRAYQPVADVVLPTPGERYAYLAIPLSLRLGQGPIAFDRVRGYTYDGQTLGLDRKAASAAVLKHDARLSFLPSFEQLSISTEAALLKAGGDDPARIVGILKELEAVLDRHIAGARPTEKPVLMLERAASRALRDEFQARQAQFEAFQDASYGLAPSRPSTNLLTSWPITEPVHDAETNHRTV